jgi:ABC-type transport system involved in cytochrome bd biosynthesis fused ATPase/permease subunit
MNLYSKAECFAVLWYAGRTGKGGDFGQIRLHENEAAKLMADHVPASLYFSDISYTLGGRAILSNISGSVKPGQVMAIMGASGAGKSTFLDILARKRKKGTVSGTTLVNGREVGDTEFKKVVGFVDQEDTLMSTLTVYETVLYSALLRLPRDMSIEAKKFRTLETMNELGILGIKDMRIGDSGRSVDTSFLDQSYPLQDIVLYPVARNAVFLSRASSSRPHQYFSWMNPQAA